MKKILKLAVCALMVFSVVACSSDKKEEAKPEEKEITIYLVRHGKTLFNTMGRTSGWTDSPLTDVGEEQAVKVGVGMKDIEFVSAFSSDLGRQRNTLKKILAENKNETPELKEHIGFREWYYGGFEGGFDSEFMDVITEKTGILEWKDTGADDVAKIDEMGLAETQADIEKRGKEAMETVVKDAQKAGGGNVLIVSSGGMIPSILNVIVPDQYSGEYIGNCSVTILKYKDGKYTVEIIGDDKYVK